MTALAIAAGACLLAVIGLALRLSGLTAERDEQLRLRQAGEDRLHAVVAGATERQAALERHVGELRQRCRDLESELHDALASSPGAARDRLEELTRPGRRR